jgi:hypothetical protein
MSTITKLIFLFAASLMFSSCDSLPHDNPLDPDNPNTNGANIIYSRYYIYADDNHNGKVNPGETIQISVYLKNTGSGTANGVEAVLRTNDPYITVLDSIARFGTINPRYYEVQGGSPYSYVFRVSSLAPVNYVVNLRLAIYNSQKYFWYDSFTMLLQ